MKRVIVAALLATLTLVGTTAAQDAPPVSAAQFQRIKKFLDTLGGKTTLAAPTLLSLGLSSDPTAPLPVVSIVTDDHKVYFNRSELNPDDYIVVVRGADNKHSYMFLTHADLKLARGLYLQANDFPQNADINSAKVRAVYNEAMAALAKDTDKTKLPEAGARQ
jgi:hypothetical protein